MSQPLILYSVFGPDVGTYFDDSNLGDIKSIRKISLYEGWLFDGMEVTYEMIDGTTKVANHLGNATANVSIDFLSTEILIGMTGKTGGVEFYGGEGFLNSVSFFVLDIATGKLRVEGPYGQGGPGPYCGKVFTILSKITSFQGLDKSGPMNELTLRFLSGEVLPTPKSL